ncbi:MAG: hypothetical protein IJ364_01465, partial [Oscillospiraceae bacterium]|nr:hypothetical protein [Oscillospiraceae bacterium]
YATANALRFWVAERGCDGALDWMDLTRFSQFFRGANGYEDLYDWCMYLLNCARTGSVIEHSASLSTPNVSEEGDYFVITTTVTLENCNWGYTYDETTMPPGTEVYGYSGYSGDNLTLYVSKEYAGYDFDICISAEDNRTPASVVYYGPDSSNMQRLVGYTLNYSSVVAEASKTVSLEASVSEDMGVVRFIKTDSVTGEPIEDVGFWIYGPNGFSSDWTDENGIIELAFEPGSYSYREGDPPDGYVVDDSRYYFTIKAGEVTEIHVKNTPIPQNNAVIEITKTDESGNALAGAEIGLYDSNQSLISSTSTGSDGKATFTDLATGTYYYKEISAPSGYVLDSVMREIVIDTAGETVTATLENTKATGTLYISKTDYDTGAALSGVEFTVYDSEKNYVTKGTTNTNGNLSISDLSLGSYYYRETKAKDGYIPDDSYHAFSLTYDGQLVSVAVKNKADIVNGNISIKKVDAYGNTLSGAVFTLESSTDGSTWSKVSEATSDASGLAAFSDLATGDILYRVTETKAPPGHNLLAGVVYEGKLSKDNPDLSFTACDCAIPMLPFTGSTPNFIPLVPLMLSMGFLYIIKRKERLNEKA